MKPALLRDRLRVATKLALTKGVICAMRHTQTPLLTASACSAALLRVQLLAITPAAEGAAHHVPASGSPHVDQTQASRSPRSTS